jgi:nucleoside-diphosphate-sugar epimerase
MSLKIVLTGAMGRLAAPWFLPLWPGTSGVSPGARSGSCKFTVGLRQVQGDLQNGAALDDLTKSADVVIHIAGVIGALSRGDYFVANEQGARAIAEAAVRNGVKRFVHISSLAAREPQLSFYGASKNAGETEVQNFKTKMSVVILRPPAVYGPGDKGTLPLLRSLTQSFAVNTGNSEARFSLYVMIGPNCRGAGNRRTGTVELDDGQRRGYDWWELAQFLCQ